jgi:hypothetical protein
LHDKKRATGVPVALLLEHAHALRDEFEPKPKMQ